MLKLKTRIRPSGSSTWEKRIECEECDECEECEEGM